MKSIVTISKYWDNPTILTSISAQGISLQIDLVDFIEALIAEVGSVTWVITDKQFRVRLEAACKTVIEGIKEESIKIVNTETLCSIIEHRED
jgi:hypothetical protein